MPPMKQYVLEDFKAYAQKSFPFDFTLVANPNIYTFKRMSFVNDNHEAFTAKLLHIGSYWAKANGPTAWAHVESSGISYYTGKLGEVCKPIRKDRQSRIYHSSPFSLMILRDERPDRDGSMTAKRMAVIETAINFAFLASGHYRQVNSRSGNAMFQDFELAYTNFHRNSSHMMAQPSSARTSLKSAFIPNDGSCLSIHKTVLPFGMNETRALNDSAAYKATTRAELAKEVETLRASLTTQRDKTSSFRRKVKSQKEKRRAAKVEVKSLKARTAGLEENLVSNLQGYAEAQKSCRILEDELERMRREVIIQKRSACEWQARHDGALRGSCLSERRGMAKAALRAFDSKNALGIKQED
ncbi:hypothetical protein GQ44DRAFT_772629 [Phaeosphaeriaceae sp. PMI808]|nr:hypothetical protein GQ44DRAFT_772629 [Phaeosphaeriaceae sp. PMI808]